MIRYKRSGLHKITKTANRMNHFGIGIEDTADKTDNKTDKVYENSYNCDL